MIIQIALYGLCVGIVGIAFHSSWELYFFIPAPAGSFGPPSNPTGFLILTSIPILLYRRTKILSVAFCTLLAMGTWLGSVVGFCFAQWKPSSLQHLLTFSLILAATFGWTHHVDDRKGE